MTKTIPNYLRIHRGIERQAPTTSEPPQNLITSFWNTYSEATGWRIDSRASRKNDMLELLPAVTSETTIGREDESTPVVGRIAATRLANAASKLTEQALRTQECLRQREAELASSAAMIGVEYDGKVSADQMSNHLLMQWKLANAMLQRCTCLMKTHVT